MKKVPRGEKSKIAKVYRGKHPKRAQLWLAKKMFQENPTIFRDIESARSILRYIEGNSGEPNRRHRKKHKEDFKYRDHNTKNDKYNMVNETSARILILDIETAPLLANIWGIWNQNVSTDNIHSDWFILTWSAKLLFDKKIYSDRVTGKEAIANDDKRVVKSLIDLLNTVDICVTHNGDRFDLPRINTRAIIHRIPPVLPYLSIDTLKVAKSHFAFTSNKLDYINKLLNLPTKTDTGMDLWRACFRGDEKGLREMEKYNINDVRIQEQTYLTMRPYMKSHPNLGLHIIDDHERCPSCGSNKLTETGKNYQTSANLYATFRCDSCGAIGRKRKALKKSGKLTSSVAK